MEAYEKKHIDALRPGLAGCTLFLKRTDDFPLKKAGEIALFGNGARHTVKGGTGSGDVNSRYYDTVETGLEKAGFSVTTREWLDAFDKELEKARKRFRKEVGKRAKEQKINIMGAAMGASMPAFDYTIPLAGEGEAAVYVLARNSGEGNDRNPVEGDFLLTKTEVREILELNRRFLRFMLVLNVGGPVDLSPVKDVRNILVLSQLGVETGDCLADILLGNRNPSGKLSTTWDTVSGYPSVGTFGGMDDSYYKEGVYVGYRYYDSVGKKPLFPFGFGLSYTDFSIRPAGMKAEGTVISASAEVTNTGAYEGREVVQVYVSSPKGSLDKPFQELKGYVKTKALAPGGSETVTVTFDLRDCTSYDEKAEAYVLDKGVYTVRIGNSSENTQALGNIELSGSVKLSAAKKSFRDPGFADWKPEKTVDSEAKGPYSVRIAAGAVKPYEVPKKPVFPFDDRIRDLSDEDLARLFVGAHAEGKGLASLIGSASFKVCGAAGECDPVIEKQLGLSTLVMADGPAGIRIADRYYITKDGTMKSVSNPIVEGMVDFLPAPARFAAKLVMGGPKKGVTVYEQYTTAIPIGTALAQSFDEEYAALCGDIVGEEMERFGIQLWLAPGMNIHRNPFCGRNFEYYSEDPFLTGRTAAAITKGVQKHHGRGVTVKHFFGNNQELNRYFHNAHISERAIREIYLKGFEICIREASPKAVMTSYNLVNGVHTSEDPALIEDVLYGEWGYRGIVMTDWVVGHEMMYPNHKHPLAKAVNVIKAGGNLFMPGSASDLKEVTAAMKDGTLKRSFLEDLAARLVENAKEFSK